MEFEDCAAQVYQVADVEWFEQPAATERLNQKLGCPVVLREIISDPTGNLWDCRGIVPTNITLAPHLQNELWWQVLHTDSDFMTRRYD